MKLHLPKQLLVAVLAVMSFSIAEGAVYVGITDTIYTEGEIPLYSTGTAEGATTTGVTHLVYYNADADGKVINNANINIEAENALWVGSGNEAYTAAASATKPTLVQLNGIITGSGTLKLNEYPSSANNIVIYELTNSASTFSGTISLQNGHGTHADNQLNLSGVGTAYQNAVVECIANVPGIINIGSSVTIGGLSNNNGRVTSTSVDNTLTLNVASDKIFGGTLGTGTYHTYSTSEGDTTFATDTSKAINLVKTGSASQTINGAANLGTVTVNAGTLNLNGATTFNGNVTNNANLNLNSDVTIAEGASVTIGGTGTTVYNKTITNYGNLTITGGITVNDLTQLTLKSSGTQAGYTDGDNGFAIVNGASYYLVDGTGTLSITNGTITVGDATNVVLDTTSEAGKASFVSSTSYSKEYYVNKAASLSSDTATAYVVNDTLTFTDEISGYKELAVQGEGQIKATFTGGDHSKALLLGNSFNGKLSILGGHMDLGAFTYGGNAVLELISGQSWNNATINNAVELNAADLDSSYDFAYSTVTLAGKVTGNYMQVTGSDNGSVTINNAETSIEQVKVTGRTLNLQNGAIEKLTMTGGTTNVSGGAITGDVVVTGGVLSISKDSALTGANVSITNANLEVNYSAEGSSAISHNTTVKIGAGGTLKLNGHDSLGWTNAAAPAKIVLEGSESSIASMVINDENGSTTWCAPVEMNGYSEISGTRINVLDAPTLSASRTGNVIKINIEARSNLNVAVANNGELEIQGVISKHQNSSGSDKLIKTGAGSLKLSGANTWENGTDIQAGTIVANNESALGTGKVTVSGGNLELATSLSVSELEVTSGSLTFGNGTKLTITEALTLDTSAIKLAEGISFSSADSLEIISVTNGLTASNVGTWTGGSYNIGGTSYTAGLSQVDDSLWLTFSKDSAPGGPITTTVLSQGGFKDGMLTLNVDGDLTSATQVFITGISDSIMADILGLSGLPEDGMVGITLKGAEGGTFTADDDLKVGFYGKDGGIYYGEQVGGAWQYQVQYIPEPASATLGLAALMMLAARRRRKD